MVPKVMVYPLMVPKYLHTTLKSDLGLPISITWMI